MENIPQVIGELGFPIAMVMVLVWFIIQNQKWHREDSKEWRDAIANNTAVMQRILGILDVKEDV